MILTVAPCTKLQTNDLSKLLGCESGGLRQQKEEEAHKACSTCASVSWPGTCCASQLALNYQTKLPLRPTCGSALGLRPASCTSRRYFSMVWCRFWYGKAADGTWGSIFLVPSVEYRNAVSHEFREGGCDTTDARFYCPSSWRVLTNSRCRSMTPPTSVISLQDLLADRDVDG